MGNIARGGAFVSRVLPVVIVLVLVFAAVKVLTGGDKHGVAYFKSVTSVYEGDKVRILGIEVGTISKIIPEGDRVKVEFSYDSKYDLPQDVKAAIVSPTLVATRFIQLAPIYSGGPKLKDGGEIPMDRTASPLEFDDLKTELSRLSTALGPTADGSDGSLARFLDVSAEAGKGQGEKFNEMVTNLSDALATLSEGRGDIFGTVRNLDVFISAVAKMDTQVVDFNSRLADVSDILDDNGGELTTAISSVDRAARLVDKFLAENRPELKKSLTKLSDVTGNLADSRDNLATLLHIAPNTATNFLNMFDQKTASYTGGLMVDNLNAPGELACALITNQLAEQDQTSQGCLKTLGPLLNAFSIPALPGGLSGPMTGGNTNPPTDDRVPDPRDDEIPQNVIPDLGGSR